MEITLEQIKDIAQESQMGMIVYINKETLEYKTLVDFANPDVDTELWQDDFDFIHNQWKNFIEIHQMKSWEAFSIMEDFIEVVDDEHSKEEIARVLSRKKPFAHFKAAVESSRYREAWFKFRDKRTEDYIKEILEEEGIEYQKE